MSSATRERPSSRAGGDLQTWAVTRFWKLVDLRVERMVRKASQMVLTLEEDLVRITGVSLVLNCGIRLFMVGCWPLVSLYIV